MFENKTILINELYKILKPALLSKKKEFKILGRSYVSEKDIWNYFRFNKWNKANNLMLCDMVDDILNTNINEIDKYIINLKINNLKE